MKPEIAKENESELAPPLDPFTPREYRAIVEDILDPWQDTEDSSDQQAFMARRRLDDRLSSAKSDDVELRWRNVEFLADIRPGSNFIDGKAIVGTKSLWPNEEGEYAYYVKIGTKFDTVDSWTPPYRVQYVAPEIAALKLHHPMRVHFIEAGSSHKTAETALNEYVVNRWSTVGGPLPTVDDVQSALLCPECSGFARRSGGHWGDLGWVHKLSVQFPCNTIRTLLPAEQ